MKDASFGQGLAVAARVAECFPRDVSHDKAQAMIDDSGFWKEYLSGASESYETYKASKLRQHPQVSEVFELTYDFGTGDAVHMPNRFGYSGDWKHDGEVLRGKHTRNFKWVQVGYQENLDAVRTALAEHGTIPEGQWLEAITETFESGGLRGVADPSWVGPDGFRYFPYVRSNGNRDFRWADNDRYVGWLWLVAV